MAKAWGPFGRHGTVEHHLDIPCSPFQTLAKHCRVHTLPCIFSDPELCRFAGSGPV